MNKTTGLKKSQNTVILLNIKSLIVAVLSITLMFMEWWRPVSPFDEIIGVISYVLVGYYLITKKINNYDTISIFLMGIVVFLGLLANVIFDINTNIKSIFVDVLTQTKVFISFIALRYFLSEKEKKIAINYLSLPAELFITSASICAVINQFVNIGMGSEKRYGLKLFSFFYSFNHQYTVCAILCFSIIVLSERIPQKRKKFLLILSTIAVIAALKSIALIFTFSYVFLFFYFKRYQRLSIKVVIPLLLLLLYVSQFQLETYLLNESSPRHTFFKYAAIDANTHFPLGSGFGTFGSAEAAKNYSALYYEYGFHHLWGMSPQYSMYLYDDYWQAIIGQFGWFGFAIFLVIYARWFITSLVDNVPPEHKALPYAIFLAMIVFGFGSAAITSSPGLIAFWALSLASSPKGKIKNKRKIRVIFK